MVTVVGRYFFALVHLQPASRQSVGLHSIPIIYYTYTGAAHPSQRISVGSAALTTSAGSCTIMKFPTTRFIVRIRKSILFSVPSHIHHITSLPKHSSNREHRV
jgi:hypothetical protein